MMSDMPEDQLKRTKVKERDMTWPDELAIVATHRVVAKDGTVQTHTIRRVIERGQFFGIDGFSTPLNGDWLITQIDRLRKA